MPAWPGGPCPQCGEQMPPNVVHCRNCRALLNADLDPDSVEIPQFIPLQEIDSYVELHPEGYHVSCPLCDRELRINVKYLDQRVSCNICAGAFRFDLSNPHIDKIAMWASCPHCTRHLRMAAKYAGAKVACKFCGGKIMILDE